MGNVGWGRSGGNLNPPRKNQPYQTGSLYAAEYHLPGGGFRMGLWKCGQKVWLVACETYVRTHSVDWKTILHMMQRGGTSIHRVYRLSPRVYHTA